jgi:hypothetical protein
MSDKWRYILVAISNCLLFIGFLFLHNKLGGADSNQRLVDLSFENNSKLIFAFLGLVVGAIFSNLVLMIRGHSRQLEKQMQELLSSALKESQAKAEAAPHSQAA